MTEEVRRIGTQSERKCCPGSQERKNFQEKDQQPHATGRSIRMNLEDAP